MRLNRRITAITFWHSMKLPAVALAALALSCRGVAGEEAPAPAQPTATVRDLGGGIYVLGGSTLNKKKRTASFSATVNMARGAVEYLIVGAGGKTHESLFVTDVQPRDLHIAMLLLGAKGSPESRAPTSATRPPETIDVASLKTAPPLTGDKISISAKWKNGGTEMAANVEDLILNTETKTAMTRGAWIYNGSSMYHGKFLAQTDQSIAALVTDPIALINNPRPGHDNDQIWEIDSAKVPPEKTQVTISIHLE